MSDPTPTSVDATEPIESKETILSEADVLAQGGLWSDDNLDIPMSWKGEASGKQKEEEEPVRLGGMSRPDSAYKLLLKKLTSEEISALTDVVTFELMTKQAIPGRNLKTGLATMVANSESALKAYINDSVRGKASSAAGIDQQARQNVQIVESKMHELEKMIAERNSSEIRVLERATDVLAAYEAKKRAEEAPGEELLRLQQERDEMNATLIALQASQAHASPVTAKPQPGRRSGRKGGLF